MLADSPKRLFGSGSDDFQQAEWLAEKLGGKWRYDHSEERWHRWDGVRWASDRTGGIIRAVADTAARHLSGDVERNIERVDNEVIRKAITKLLNLPPTQRALEALATLEGYGTDGSDWDTNPNLLGCSNGIVDLRLNAIVPSSPEMLVTRSTGVRFSPIAGPADFARVAPKFIESLSQWTADYDQTEDASMMSFLLLWFGASLFGIHPEQRFLLMTGGGRNGKGALRHAILHAVGPEYGVQPDANMYSRNRMGPARSNDARADLMALRGRRIAFFSEPDKGQFNEEMLKAHTGGDIITARGLYQKVPQSWEPTHSITFLVNDAPSIEDVGPSMGSRVMVADFRHRFEGTAENKRLYDELKAERAGVLAILCWAAKRWYEQWSSGGAGLELPARVVEQSKAFMERNDPVAECLREAFVVHPDMECAGQVAYDAYREWHERSGRTDDPLGMWKFTSELEKKGYQRYRTMHSRGWKGLKPLGAMALAEREDDSED